jgi:hypothetical protein
MKFLFLSLLLFLGSVRAAPTFVLKSTKDMYPISWETIYRLNVCNDYSTVIEPPRDHVLQDIILGDSKLFKAERSENRAIIKRLAPDNARTNLVLILEGPDKSSRSLTFELTGEASPQIANVQFFVPGDARRDAALEATRNLYQTQLQMTLAEQERRLGNTIRERTVEKLETFRLLGINNAEPTREKLGVHVALDAVVNSGGKGYVYLTTNATDPEYQVVHLTGIKGKDLAKTVSLFRTTREKGRVRYIYETTPFVKSGEDGKYEFLLRVYRENIRINAKVL